MDLIKSHQQLAKLPNHDILSLIQKLLLNISPDPSPRSPVLKEQMIEAFLKQISKSSSRETFSLSFTEKIEGCHPLLKQIWNISFTPDCKHFTHLTNFTSEFSVIQNNLKAENIFIEVNQKPALLPAWDSRLSYSSIRKYPITPYSIGHNGKCLTIQIEYQLSILKPRIIEQNLGMRPRLVSFDAGEDLKDYKIEQSPSRTSRQKRLSLIHSESFYEENEIGFSLINSTLADYTESDEEFQIVQDIFDLDLKSSQPQSEDSQISMYIQKCVKIGQLQLFGNTKEPLGS